MKDHFAEQQRLEAFHELVGTIVKMGYPQEFGIMVARNLGGEKTMRRMIGYLRHAKPRSAEEIADEMLSIMDDRARWIQKKSAEYYNSKYNELLYYGLGTEDDEDPEEEPGDYPEEEPGEYPEEDPEDYSEEYPDGEEENE